MSALPAADASSATYRLDKRRAVTQGIIETGAQTFFLLVAVSFFHAGPVVKTLLVVSGPLGLVLNPGVLSLVRMLRWTAARGASACHLLAACGFLLAALPLPLWGFVVGCMTGVIGTTLAIPLLTQIYQNNYSKSERGTLFSKTVVVRVLTAAAFSWLGGHWLDHEPGHYRWMMLCFSAASAAGAALLARMPSSELSRVASSNPFHGLRHVRHDAPFRWLLVSWMLMGFGNLMMLPLRVDFVANPAYGIMLPPDQVALLTGVIPSVTMLCLTMVWGLLFDRVNFYVLRFLLNAFFIAGLALYFLVGGMPGFVLGSVCFGVAMSGGNIAWSLWVTKIARPHDVAEYMSVHTALAGLRGLVAPALGFWLASSSAIQPLTWTAIALITAGTLILTPEATTIRRRRPGEPVVPRDLD